jgi:putative phosphoribosyl transferase
LVGRKGWRARFNDRTHAGYELALDLRRFVQGQDPIVLAIPPDGIHVAASVALELDTPLDVVISRRIVAPGHEEETLGAITPDRTLVLNKPLVSKLGLSDEEVEQLTIPEWAEAQRAMQRYRRGRPASDLQGRCAVIVDDGLTTGYTMIAAVVAARNLEPARVVVAVPVASIEAIERVRGYVDDLLSLEISVQYPYSVEGHYARYEPLGDRDVIWTLDHFWSERPPQGFSETF